jgi:hypothetical protein
MCLCGFLAVHRQACTVPSGDSGLPVLGSLLGQDEER